MEAAKAADFVATLPGNVGAQSDATQACALAYLAGIKTCMRLPRHERPASRQGMKDPVCRLNEALCGHPDSGALGSCAATVP
eukprot:2843085-Alexandrium_andersonii.AAC.1